MARKGFFQGFPRFMTQRTSRKFLRSDPERSRSVDVQTEKLIFPRSLLMKNFRFILTVVLALLVFALSAFSQGSTGRLVGTVTDPGGAVIPGATVTVKDNQTGCELTVVASSEGGFTFSQLQVGAYTVTVTATGYSTFTATDVKIDSNRDNTLNVAMTVGGVKENVTVVAGADIVNSVTGELS